MSEFFTTGEWIAKEGQTDEFVGAWEVFASWAASKPGAGQLRLTQDLGDPHRFVSFGSWNDPTWSTPGRRTQSSRPG